MNGISNQGRRELGCGEWEKWLMRYAVSGYDLTPRIRLGRFGKRSSSASTFENNDNDLYAL